MKITKQLVSWHTNNDHSITLNCDESSAKIFVLSDDIIRIRTSFTKEFVEESYVLTMTAWPDRFDELLKNERQRVTPLKLNVSEEHNCLSLKTASLKLVINKSPFYIQLFNENDQLIYSDLKSKPYVLDQLNRVSHYSEIDIDNDYFYGFGEKTGTINKLRRRMVQSPKDTLAYDPEYTDPLYKHIPFYIKLNQQTKHAIGFFYHNTFESVFDMGVEHSNYHHRYCSFQADGGDIDLFICNGPTIAKVVERYTDLTGKTAMQPIYSLGYLGSTMYYVELPENCDNEIIDFARKCRSEDIPIDNFHLSSGYTVDESNKRQLFTWNVNKFPNPGEFFSNMQQEGVPTTPNIKPGVLLTNPNYSSMAANGIFIGKHDDKGSPYVDYWWGGLGSFVDFTNPKARGSWTEYLNETLFKYGVTSLWNDNCEYDSLADKDAYCNFDGKGVAFAGMKAILPNLMAFTGRQAMLACNPSIRPYSVNRGGYAGIQRYSQTWAGDNFTSWKTLKFNIATILGMGLSGVANNGCDIGGFWGPHPEPELFVRWVQNGVFQPRFSIHSCNTDNTVTEPWMYQDYTSYIRDAIKLRYQLMPYWYALLREANLLGTPMMRPLFYEFQEDSNCYNQGVDFMVGKSLLVANIVEKGATLREIYLPKGTTWFDFYSYQEYTGGSTISLNVDLSSIPLFIRSDGIIALTQDEARLNDGFFNHLKLIFGGEAATVDLYQDDGISQGYLASEYCASKVSLKTQGEQKIIHIVNSGKLEPLTDKFEIELINKAKGPYWVSVAGRRLKQYLHRDKFSQSHEGWYYSNQKGAVEIKLDFPINECEVIISFAHFDLIGM